MRKGFNPPAARPPMFADHIPVRCAHDVIVPTDSLVPHPKNPNKHPAAQIKKLAGIIKATGWRHTITISRRSGFIVAGEGRLLAARAGKMAAVPIEYQDFKSNAEELAHVFADNQLAELSEWDSEMALDGLKELASDGALDLSGFEVADLGKFGGGDFDRDPPPPAKGASKLTHKCPKCGHRWTASA